MWLKQKLARRAHASLIRLFEKNQTRAPYAPDGEQVGQRSLKNACLALLATLEEDGPHFAQQQYEEADNLTDRLAALAALTHNQCAGADEAIADFDKRYRCQPLVIDKWFALQAMSPNGTALPRIKELMRHPMFSITNPNRIRALVGSFATGNPSQFHRLDGAGYQFVTKLVIELDEINPQVAARLLTSFSAWKQLEPKRREKAERALKRIAHLADLSNDVRDIIQRTLV